MRKADHSNQNLDRIGAEILRRGRLSDAEIDRIAGSEHLYANVIKGIRVERAARAEGEGRSSSRSRFTFATAVALVLLISVSAVVALFVQEDPRFNSSIDVPAAPPEKARLDITPQVIVKGFTLGRADIADSASSIVTVATGDRVVSPGPERAVYREARSSRVRPQMASYSAEPEPGFIAVSYIGDEAESLKGGRVIRADVPRSTLFAMGLNVPLEGASPTLKADLLLGPDGVTRAVRLVDRF